jgi:hypothetical protein
VNSRSSLSGFVWRLGLALLVACVLLTSKLGSSQTKPAPITAVAKLDVAPAPGADAKPASDVKWTPSVGPKAGWRKRDACSDFVIIKNTS